MAGRLNKSRYPSDSMVDVFHVEAVGSTLALTVADPELVTVENDGSRRASRAGDVLSRDPGGFWIGRPPGTNGVWEQTAANGSIRVYNPEPGGVAVGFVYWSVPNE